MLDKSNDRLRRTAFHEAGHAWMMVREGLGVRSVSLKASGAMQGDNRGETVPEQSMEEGRRELAGKFARAALAGCIAEHYLMGTWDEEGLRAKAFDTGRAMSCVAMSGDDLRPEALDYYVQALSNAVMEEMSEPKAWNEITGLAYRLLEAGDLTGEEIAAILSDR